MVSIQDDNSFSYDSWAGNKATPLPFTLVGAENILNLDFFIEYYQGKF
jgi:hypothetical protein